MNFTIVLIFLHMPWRNILHLPEGYHFPERTGHLGSLNHNLKIMYELNLSDDH